MIKKIYYNFELALKPLVLTLLKLSIIRVAALFLTIAVLFAITLVSIIDFLWDGQFSTELEFAGVVVSLLDGGLIIGLLVALLSTLREEVKQRKKAEQELRELNDELDAKVQERTQQLLEAQEELVRKESLAVLGKIADNVGHELRNPLGVMNNAVYFLQTVLPDADESVKEYLDIIHDEIEAADHILSDLLDAVRTKPPRPENVEIGELIAQVLQVSPVPETITVQLDIPTSCPPLLLDPLQIQQVFRNLITNAMEAMPEGGTLEIRAAENKPEGIVTISVRDSGIGMRPEILPKLFQPLFTTKIRRIGLGLAVVKKLTEANGGSVTVQSIPGDGSTFTLAFPAADGKKVSL